MRTQSSLVIWPWWVRLSHWLVASSVILLWILVYGYYETDQTHRWIGYGLIVMIGLRVLAGCNTQSAAARFVLIKPQQIIQHIQHLKQGTLPLQHGHNSLGMLAVYWLWACIMLLAVTGWLSRTDALWGEDWPVDLHACLSYILMASVVLHVVAVAVVSRLARQHLVLQMLHGQLAQFKGKPTRKHSSKR